jgi:hypothetical protein
MAFILIALCGVTGRLAEVDMRAVVVPSWACWRRHITERALPTPVPKASEPHGQV